MQNIDLEFWTIDFCSVLYLIHFRVASLIFVNKIEEFFPRKLKKCEFYRIDQEFFDILSNFLLTNYMLVLPRKFKHFDKRNEDFTAYPERVFTILQKYSHT